MTETQMGTAPRPARDSNGSWLGARLTVSLAGPLRPGPTLVFKFLRQAASANLKKEAQLAF